MVEIQVTVVEVQVTVVEASEVQLFLKYLLVSIQIFSTAMLAIHNTYFPPGPPVPGLVPLPGFAGPIGIPGPLIPPPFFGYVFL